MAIPDHTVRNFQTMQKASDGNRLALMECVEKTTGLPRYLVCAVTTVKVKGSGEPEYQFAPFAVMLEGNPYEDFTPPTSEAA